MHSSLSHVQARKRGFTLIELMVVVAIIGILAAIGLATFSGAQARARNAQLKANVKAYQAAIEQTYNDQSGVYGSVDGTNFASGQVPTGVSISGNGTASYCVYTTETLNTTDDTNHGANCTVAAGVCTFTTGAGANRFCMRNMQ